MHEEEGMKTMITRAVLGLTLGATALTAAAPAEAQRYRHRDRDDAGAAIVAGIAGVVIGAAIAGSARDRYDDRYYYDDRRYDGYYRQRGYYPRESYHYRDYERRGWRGCSIRRVYDPYLGRRVKVRYCR
jgi:phosphate-selective porin